MVFLIERALDHLFPLPGGARLGLAAVRSGFADRIDALGFGAGQGAVYAREHGAEIHAEAETSEADGGGPSFNEWRCDFGKPFEELAGRAATAGFARQHDGEIGAV